MSRNDPTFWNAESGWSWEETKIYYRDRFRRFGATPEGVDWKDSVGQALRFAQLDLAIFQDGVASVCDFGCGFGAYADHLRSMGWTGAYVGVDIVHEMVSHARDQLSDGNTKFSVSAQPIPADVVVASGVFNVRAHQAQAVWQEQVDKMIISMWKNASSSIAYNFLPQPTTDAHRRPWLHYSTEEHHYQLISQLGGQLEFRRDYGLHEVTVIARKGRQDTHSKEEMWTEHC